jgi:hypothetical protein
MPTRRRLLALVSWVLIASTARAWSGHSATRSVVTITAFGAGRHAAHRGHHGVPSMAAFAKVQ